ncbi:hypothetical protein D3C84_1105200 [compost metagenome]
MVAQGWSELSAFRLLLFLVAADQRRYAYSAKSSWNFFYGVSGRKETLFLRFQFRDNYVAWVNDGLTYHCASPCSIVD